MRKLHIFNLLVAFLVIVGCTKEKDYTFDGVAKTENVNFKAINLTVGYPDSALSAKFEGYFGEEWTDPERRDSLSINYYRQNDWNLSEEWEEHIDVRLYYRNVLWSGGYNEIQFTFIPSCPEEKEAKFTMPDGQVFIATVDKPTFTWTVSREKWTESQLWDYNRLIATAESSYQRGGNQIEARGYVIISLDYDGNRLRYNPNNGKWYWSEWMDNPDFTLYGNVDFSVENITVGDIDSAISKIYNGEYYDFDWKDNESFTLDLYNIVDSVPELYYNDYRVDLYYKNVLWAAKNNQLKVTFRPSQSEPDGAKFFMPDGKEVYLTATDSVYVWTLDSTSLANSVMENNRLFIKAENNHCDNNVTMDNHGIVGIDVDSDVRFDSALKLWLYDRYTRQNRSNAIRSK